MALAVGALATCCGTAGAVILPPTTIDGPSADVVGFGGVAMAEDGSGGLVYLKRVEGVAHVFVARYSGGQWQPPIRVDPQQPFAASWPRIGAANGGQLVVVWATPFASEGARPVDRLLGATLGPGSGSFGPAFVIDRNIGQGTGTSPDLAMSPSGQADVVYRVVTSDPGEPLRIPLLGPGDVAESVRVAHYGGERWSHPAAINRNPGASMRPPTEANAPQVAVGPTGNGIVVWQEPDVEGVARIWARRLFGANVDYAMPVSATSFAGKAIGDDADAPSVGLSRLGQAEVAYRQPAGPGSPLPGPRIFVNTLPDGESTAGGEFEGARIADTALAGGSSGSVGRPSIDLNEKRDVRLVYDNDGVPRVVEGTALGAGATLSLGPPFVGSNAASPSELPCASVIAPEGGGISAWPSADPQGNPGVAVREDFADGSVQTEIVGGGGGGAVAALAVARSGLGDGLLAFQQGPLGNAAIVAVQATAPPENFVTNVPAAWIKPAKARISWQPAPSANGPLRYTVVLDGRRLRTLAGALSFVIDSDTLGDGVHKVAILATDMYGRSLLTRPSALRIDGQPPTVKITQSRVGRRVVVRVSDAQSGVDTSALSVDFGDGKKARGRAGFTHRYAHAGVYKLIVRVRDRIGNRGVVRRLVSVR